ncbi:MAG: hypothetical protein VKJ64_06495 [Leptolyngbyaceae bacterium]|nr:hypothetical protein [Leptolyngbyaceae bacterium]
MSPIGANDFLYGDRLIKNEEKLICESEFDQEQDHYQVMNVG